METITVNVQIQLDVNSTKNKLEQVQDILDTVNKIISMSELDAQPQIFVNSIDNSDIVETL